MADLFKKVHLASDILEPRQTTWLFRSPEDFTMALALRHRDDTIAEMSGLAQLSTRRETDPAVMARLQGKTIDDMAHRFELGHRAYVACWNGEPVSWGWVATREAEIGELRLRFAIPAGDRYLWNFVTLPSHRGLGIYPRLLDTIVKAESNGAERFWIAYAPENHASESGIRKAGFVTYAELSFDMTGKPALRVVAPDEAAAAKMFGIPMSDDLSACWRCTREAASSPTTTQTSCATTASCCCDYQHPEVTCAA
jgi:GNAT superfamily N-acetyltransferase